MQIRTILYQYIKTLIKHVFLLNFTHELLMSFVKAYKTLNNWENRYDKNVEHMTYNLNVVSQCTVT